MKVHAPSVGKINLFDYEFLDAYNACDNNCQGYEEGSVFLSVIETGQEQIIDNKGAKGIIHKNNNLMELNLGTILVK